MWWATKNEWLGLLDPSARRGSVHAGNALLPPHATSGWTYRSCHRHGDGCSSPAMTIRRRLHSTRP
jgi:hypothetical protein